MELKEKQHIAAKARELIRLLLHCDDLDFVELVVEAVVGGYDYLLKEIENL